MGYFKFLSKWQHGKTLNKCLLDPIRRIYLNLPDCFGQCHDDGANMKEKEAGLQARFLQIILKTLYTPSAMNLVVEVCAQSSTELLLFFGVLKQLYALFSSSTQCWTILKNVLLSYKSQSATR